MSQHPQYIAVAIAPNGEEVNREIYRAPSLEKAVDNLPASFGEFDAPNEISITTMERWNRMLIENITIGDELIHIERDNLEGFTQSRTYERNPRNLARLFAAYARISERGEYWNAPELLAQH